jgi:acyl-homoserine-lactone acylase
MKKLLLAVAVIAAVQISFASPQSDLSRWQQQAKNVTIVRDDWGIAHVHGKTDADAVFGAVYAQAEDDFNRVETNYLTNLGRLAEAEGEGRLYQDLRAKMFLDWDDLKKDYDASPVWLKSLMNAWADGLNFYLSTHPQVKPRVITHFEPWMALSFTEGSIGGDVEKVNLGQLQSLYGNAGAGEPAIVEDDKPVEPGGSNGMAVAPSNTTTKHALLLINPHTSFYFRSELQMTSDEGLNAYGASTWGQFFIYQGFNEKVGWMHTSSAADATDEFLETVEKQGGHYVYKHGSDSKPVAEHTVTAAYKTASGMMTRTFKTYSTEHGPVVRELNGKWVAFAMMNEPIKALIQSYSRTKATDYASFRQTLEVGHTNSSNNTIFASAQGDIAYFHGNYIPKRDTEFDWTRPVDGSNPATDYHGLLSVDETPKLFNPASGWLYNSNDSPWQSAGPSSPKKDDFPVYVDSGIESARGHHAVRVLSDKKDFTLDGLLAAAYDTYLTWFEKPMPALIKAWDATPDSNPLKAKTADQIAVLRKWDLRFSVDSVATSLAIFWGGEIQRSGGGRRGGGGPENAAPDVMLQALVAASDKLTADFGKWQTPWGAINRFQRLNDNINANFDDAQPGIPVMFPAATWGSLASFAARAYPNTKKWYGTSGNSFVAVVEFGPTVKARAVTAGGESGDPKSKHFNDQAERYATGNLREVYFYPAQLKGHTEREYHPGS